MPNWCWNTLKVSGKAEELKKFVLETQGLPASYPPQEWEKGLERVTPTEKFFCFNALVPTPQAVLDMGYDAHGKLPQNIWDLLRQGHPVEKIDGYHWSIQNWGGLRAVSLSIFRLLRPGRRPRGGLKRSSSFTLSLRLNFTMKNPGAFLQASCMVITVHFQ